MTHPKGAIAYSPNVQFVFPRSYVFKLHVFTNNDNPVTLVDNQLIVTSFGSPNFTMFIKLRDDFMVWSSKTYQIKTLIEWWYYTLSPGGTEIPYGTVCKFEYLAMSKCHVLTIETDSPNTHHFFDIDQQPPDYWLPPEIIL